MVIPCDILFILKFAFENAVVTGDASVEALKQAVVDAGYEVTDVK